TEQLRERTSQYLLVYLPYDYDVSPVRQDGPIAEGSGAELLSPLEAGDDVSLGEQPGHARLDRVLPLVADRRPELETPQRLRDLVVAELGTPVEVSQRRHLRRPRLLRVHRIGGAHGVRLVAARRIDEQLPDLRHLHDPLIGPY